MWFHFAYKELWNFLKKKDLSRLSFSFLFYSGGGGKGVRKQSTGSPLPKIYCTTHMKVNLSKSGWGIILGHTLLSVTTNFCIDCCYKIFAREVVEVIIIIIFIDKAAENPVGEHRTQWRF